MISRSLKKIQRFPNKITVLPVFTFLDLLNILDRRRVAKNRGGFGSIRKEGRLLTERTNEAHGPEQVEGLLW
jgi:hypothetical protein